MSVEIEAAGVDGAGSWFRRRRPAHARPPGSPCANCGAVLMGPWCHACGQLAEDFHRSLRHLLFEALEGFTHFDGRFWRTVPRLIARPGQLTRDYIEGHRASQIPPLRLFLVALLLVFFTGALEGYKFQPVQIKASDGAGRPARVVRSTKELTRAEQAELDRGIKLGVSLGKGGGATAQDSAAARWLTARLKAALSDPERFTAALEPWLERFAFLMLPVAASLLSLLFVFQRRFFVFDHAIFSLHSLSFQGLLLTAVIVLSRAAPAVAPWLMWAAPVHLFTHMRGTYRTSVVGTLARMAVLFVGSAIGFGLLMLGLLLIGFYAIGAAT